MADHDGTGGRPMIRSAIVHHGSCAPGIYKLYAKCVETSEGMMRFV
jgi:hypothetical protein